MNDMIDMEKIKESLSILKPDGQLFEIRIMKGKQIISGYFKDADTLLECFNRVDLRGSNVYITLNQINEALFSRQQSETFIAGANSTDDPDVDGYKWLFIDLDPERVAEVSSSDDELEAARLLSDKVHADQEELYGRPRLQNI